MHAGFGPNLVRQEPIGSRNVSPAPFLRGRALESGGLLCVEAAAIEPAARNFWRARSNSEDVGLLSDVLTLFLRAVFTLQRRRARRQGLRRGQVGAVSFGAEEASAGERWQPPNELSPGNAESIPNELLHLWMLLTQREKWSSLVVVPAQPGTSGRALLCVSLGSTQFSAARYTLELTGKARFLGSVTLQPRAPGQK
jgi:hypothetical protein